MGREHKPEATPENSNDSMDETKSTFTWPLPRSGGATVTSQLAWSELSALQRDVLFEIRRQQQSDGITHGARIRYTLSEQRERPLDNKSLYRVINTLTELGLITKQYADGRRKHLKLTNQAIQLLEKQAQEMATAVNM